ncbi:MAG: hypothetical protein FWC32_05555 [Firmicutes bacterium]|nr:hypothetical protein [Bacillota bacterium]
MKNNIIIAGVPRAGKSTLSRMLSKKFGFQHVSMDSINNGLEKVFPQLGIDICMMPIAKFTTSSLRI